MMIMMIMKDGRERESATSSKNSEEEGEEKCVLFAFCFVLGKTQLIRQAFDRLTRARERKQRARQLEPTRTIERTDKVSGFFSQSPMGLLLLLTAAAASAVSGNEDVHLQVQTTNKPEKRLTDCLSGPNCIHGQASAKVH